MKYISIAVVGGNSGILFHSCTVHLDIIKVFTYQLMHNSFALKEY